MSLSPQRGRSRSRPENTTHQRTPASSQARSIPRRSISPRSASRSRSLGRAKPFRDENSLKRNGPVNGRSRTRSRSRSPSRQRGGWRSRTRSISRSPSRMRSVPRSSKIVIEKLTKNVNENHIREIFGAYGMIKDLDLPINRQFMTNRGTAYILYTDNADAEAAIAHMHEAQLDGAVISVSIVLPRRRFSRSPPARRRGAPNFDRFESRGLPPGGYRAGGAPSGYNATMSARYRSPPPARRISPPRRYGGRPGQRDRDFDTYRPRSYSRSLSRRTRSPSLSSRSRSRSISRGGRNYRRRDISPVPKGGSRRKRSPSYSSYSSYSDRSRSRGRGRYDRPR